MAKPIDVLTNLLEAIAAKYGEAPPGEDDEEVDQAELQEVVNESLAQLDE